MWSSFEEQFYNGAVSRTYSYDENTYLSIQYNDNASHFVLTPSINLLKIVSAVDNSMFAIDRVGFKMISESLDELEKVVSLIQKTVDVMGVPTEFSVFISPNHTNEFERFDVVPCSLSKNDIHSVEVISSFDNMYIPDFDKTEIFVKAGQITFEEVLDVLF